MTRVVDTLERLAMNQESRGEQSRTTFKTTQLLDFPKGSVDALENLDMWLDELNRVVNHVSGGRGLVPQDKITHMLAAWPMETDVGENLRMDQRTLEYKEKENSATSKVVGLFFW